MRQNSTLPASAGCAAWARYTAGRSRSASASVQYPDGTSVQSSNSIRPYKPDPIRALTSPRETAASASVRKFASNVRSQELPGRGHEASHTIRRRPVVGRAAAAPPPGDVRAPRILRWGLHNILICPSRQDLALREVRSDAVGADTLDQAHVAGELWMDGTAWAQGPVVVAATEDPAGPRGQERPDGAVCERAQ